MPINNYSPITRKNTQTTRSDKNKQVLITEYK